MHESLEGKTDGLDFDLIRKLRLIPASTVAGSRIIVAAVPDTVYINTGGENYEAKRVYISIDRDGNDFGGYGGIVPLSLCT